MLKTNKTELDKSDITKYILNHSKEKAIYDYLYCLYKAQHNILNRTVKNCQQNNKIVINYPSYISDINTGYFMGKPITYTSKDKQMLEDIQEVFNYNDEQEINMLLAKYASIKGKSYEILYLDNERNELTGEEEIKLRQANIPAEETILIYNNKIQPDPIFAIRYFEIDEEYKVEFYTYDKIYYYCTPLDCSSIQFIEEKENYFKDIPIIEYPNNDEAQGDFEKVLTAVNAYDLVTSNSANTFEYNDEAILKIVNFSGTKAEDVTRMKEEGAVMVDSDGDIDWIIKNINDTALQNHKKNLKDEIHTISKTPNLGDENFAGNLSGVAIEFKLWPLEQNAVQKERKFKKSLQRRLELMCKYFEFKRDVKYDWRNIKVTFNRNMPTNITELTETLKGLKGILSNQTIFSKMPFVDNVLEEQELINKEKAAYDIDLDDEDDLGGEQ